MLLGWQFYRQEIINTFSWNDQVTKIENNIQIYTLKKIEVKDSQLQIGEHSFPI